MKNNMVRVSANVTKIGVNVDPENVRANHERYEKMLRDSSRKLFDDKEFDSVSLNGPGVDDFIATWGEEPMNEIMATEIASNWVLQNIVCADQATVQDVFDAVPAGSTIRIEADLETDVLTGTVKIFFRKEEEEGKGLGCAFMRLERNETVKVFK